MEIYHSIYYDQLKRDLVQKSGVSMTSFSDTVLLAAHMEAAKYSISAHTLARFFGFLPKRKLYPNTLQIICNYLGFEHFEAYRNFVQQTHNRSLFASNGLFENESHSLQSFEMAIQLMDLNEIQEHLDCIDFTHERIEEIAHLSGFLVRNAAQQSRLLELLIQTSNGRRLFFERFVDEDDPNGYFSSALQKYYFKEAKSSNSKLFYNCYLIANASYHHKKINEDWVSAVKKEMHKIDYRQLHFHEVSRVFETQILIDFQRGGYSQNSLTAIQDEILIVIQSMNNHAKAWVLARVMKALAFSNQLSKAMQNNDFYKALVDVHKENDVTSIGELIVQLVFSRYAGKESNELSVPRTLKSHYFQNEYNTRLSTEAATKYFYAKPHEQEKTRSLLQNFSQKTGTSWVLNVINN
jgi:hypothetical protein